MNINKLIEELDAKYAKATPMTMHSDDPSIEYAFAVANAYPDLRNAILELQKESEAGKGEWKEGDYYLHCCNRCGDRGIPCGKIIKSTTYPAWEGIQEKNGELERVSRPSQIAVEIGLCRPCSKEEYDYSKKCRHVPKYVPLSPNIDNMTRPTGCECGHFPNEQV